MTSPLARMPLRVARPSRDLAAAERFWCDGVGLQVLCRVHPEAPGEHSLLMLGTPEAQWHLELVEDSDLLSAHPPGPEDLLVLYCGSAIDEDWVRRIEDAGGKRVGSRNPYWDEWGVTLLDPDGYRLVLSTRTWGPGATAPL